MHKLFLPPKHLTSCVTALHGLNLRIQHCLITHSIRNFIALAFVTLFAISSSIAQSPLYSQQYASPLYTMPTLVGWHGGMGLYQQYRNQWPGLSANFVTYDAGVDGYVHKLRSGFGLNVQHDRAGSGIVITNQVSMHWSPKIKVSDQAYLSPVFTLTYLQSSIDWSRLTFGDQIDERFGFIYNTSSSPGSSEATALAYGYGFAFIRNGFIGSAYCGYINQPNMSFFENAESRYPRHWRVNLAQRMVLSSKLSLTPTLAFQRQAEFNHLNIGMNAQYRSLFAALAYRWNDAAIVAMGIDIKNTVRISYSYDMTVSRLGTQSGGAHELGVRTLLFRKQAKHAQLKELPLL